MAKLKQSMMEIDGKKGGECRRSVAVKPLRYNPGVTMRAVVRPRPGVAAPR